ncbi:hypothetical protein X975_12830, partial [Stegodyphus mimosarum]
MLWTIRDKQSKLDTLFGVVSGTSLFKWCTLSATCKYLKCLYCLRSLVDEIKTNWILISSLKKRVLT